MRRDRTIRENRAPAHLWAVWVLTFGAYIAILYLTFYGSPT